MWTVMISFRFAMSASPSGGCDGSGGLVGDAVEVRAVPPQQLVRFVGGHAVFGDLVAGDLAVDGPVADGMGEVAGPHDVVEHLPAAPDPEVVGQEGDKDVSAEVLAW